MLTFLLCFIVVLLFGILYTLERMRKSLVGDAELEDTSPMSIKGLLDLLCMATARKEMRETGKDSNVFWDPIGDLKAKWAAEDEAKAKAADGGTGRS